MEVLGLHIHIFASFSNNFHRHQIVIPAVIRKLRITENTMPTATKTMENGCIFFGLKKKKLRIGSFPSLLGTI